MKIIDGDRFTLQGNKGEVITVTVTSEGTAHLVRYEVIGGQVINGPNEGSMQVGVPLKFSLRKTNGDPNTLDLGFTFASPQDVGGEPGDTPPKYVIAVTGDAPNSDTSREAVRGSFGIPGDAVQWAFFVS